MNSKIALTLVILLSGCGVKKAPMRPIDKLVPSYIDEFEQKTQPPPNATK